MQVLGVLASAFFRAGFLPLPDGLDNAGHAASLPVCYHPLSSEASVFAGNNPISCDLC